MVLLPLWSSYLVRIYAWQTILAHNGAINWALNGLGLPDQNLAYTNTAMWIVYSYVWLPFMVLPVYAALERIPDSYLEASADLGARGWRTFRSVDPAAGAARRRRRLDLHVRADARRLHHAAARRRHELPDDRERTSTRTSPPNLPFAAAFAVIPMAIMGVYLLIARRLGAFEAPVTEPRHPHLARGLVGARDRLPLDPARDHRALRVQRLDARRAGRSRAGRLHWFSVAWHNPDVRSALRALAQGRRRHDGHRARARDDGRGRRGPLPLLRPGGGLVPARPAARAARDHHRDGAELVLHLRRDPGTRSGRS